MDELIQASKVNRVIREAVGMQNPANRASSVQRLEEAMDEFSINHESAENLLFCYMRTQNELILEHLLKNYAEVLTSDEIGWVEKRLNKN